MYPGRTVQGTQLVVTTPAGLAGRVVREVAAREARRAGVGVGTAAEERPGQT